MQSAPPSPFHWLDAARFKLRRRLPIQLVLRVSRRVPSERLDLCFREGLGASIVAALALLGLLLWLLLWIILGRLLGGSQRLGDTEPQSIKPRCNPVGCTSRPIVFSAASSFFRRGGSSWRPTASASDRHSPQGPIAWRSCKHMLPLPLPWRT